MSLFHHPIERRLLINACAILTFTVLVLPANGQTEAEVEAVEETSLLESLNEPDRLYIQEIKEHQHQQASVENQEAEENKEAAGVISLKPAPLELPNNENKEPLPKAVGGNSKMDQTRLTYQLRKVMAESTTAVRAHSTDNEIIKPVTFFYRDPVVTVNLARSSAVFAGITDEKFMKEFSKELNELENLYLKARAEGKEGLDRDAIKPYAIKIHEMEGKDHSFPPYHMFVDLAKKNEQIEERFWQLIESIFNEAGNRYVDSKIALEKSKQNPLKTEATGKTAVRISRAIDLKVHHAHSQQEFESMMQSWNNASYSEAKDIRNTSQFIQNNWDRLKDDEIGQIGIASQAYSEILEARGLDEVREAGQILDGTTEGREVNKNYNESVNKVLKLLKNSKK